ADVKCLGFLYLYVGRYPRNNASRNTEALEEVFWRTFHGSEYIQSLMLAPHGFSIETTTAFRMYQQLVCQRYRKRRYLSKNNNHILRIRSLSATFDDALILIPFRAPLEQAHSLWRQHQRFRHSSPFVQRYMQWLAHHEFGATHRPFAFGKNWKKSGLDPETLDYWLERWIDVYQYLLTFLLEKLVQLRLNSDTTIQHSDALEVSLYYILIINKLYFLFDR
ncbi:MAG: hypothetical protein BECKG1743E_GA0114224_100961, partial [Candidatus Kentron sp. G]